jgi:hypothetical protein
MILFVKSIFWYCLRFLQSLCNHHQFALEFFFLKQQLAMTTYKRKRFTFNKFEKLFIIFISQIFPSWKNSLIIVKPKTVIQWKHTFFRWF